MEDRIRASEERLRLGEAAGGIATFELDLDSRKWDWSPRAAALFGFPEGAEQTLDDWEQTVFVDDLPKIHAAIDEAPSSGRFYVEFRVRHSVGSLHWLAAKGEVSGQRSSLRLLRGA